MQLEGLKRRHANKKEKRVGRGGKRGKTAGRGTKGQKARAGHRMRPEMRDIIKKYPKHRGYKQKAFRIKPTPVNLSALEKAFISGDAVTVSALLEKNLVKKIGGKNPAVKILATGTISKSLSISGCSVSSAAKKAIEAAGGKIA
jgi:large subunit ribosomal protein L15